MEHGDFVSFASKPMSTSPTESLSAAFDRACERWAKQPAFIEQSGFEVTFERYYYTVHSLAHALLQRDLSPGQLIGICVGDVIFKFGLTLAAIRRGLRVRYVPPELVKTGVPDDFALVIADEPELQAIAKCAILDASWLAPAPGPVEDVGIGGIITGTSGTTGSNKFQFYSERTLVTRAEVAGRRFSVDDGPMLIGYSPGSGVGFGAALRALLVGRLQVNLTQGFGFALKVMERMEFGEARMPPITLREFTLAARESPGPHRIRTIWSGGSELTQTLAALAREVFGARVFHGYGSSEAGAIARLEFTGKEPAGAVGPIEEHLRWRFLDPETGEVAAENSGELSLKVPESHQKSNYIGGEGPYDAEGWIRTGDLGYVNEDRLLVLTGRVHQFMNIGGEKSLPSRYERMAMEFGGIAEAAAFVVPDELGVDRLQLAIIPGDEFDETAFVEGCAGSLLAHLPVDVFVVSSLPYSDMNKLDRAKLASMSKPDRTIYSH